MDLPVERQNVNDTLVIVTCIYLSNANDICRYSQITWPFYDVYLGIVMVFDALSGSVGPLAGHVHCRLAWSRDGLTG